jgi:hypothetical protein
MTFLFVHHFKYLRGLLLITCLLAASSHAQLNQTAVAKLEATQTSPDSAGTLIYRGSTFNQRATSGDPLFRYERRVLSIPSGMIASNITSDLTGRVIIMELNELSSQYEIHRFEATNMQAGFSGIVKLSNGGRHLEYELNDNGKITKATEVVSDPVVSGPSIFGFILKNWEPLVAGTSLPIRMLVLKDKTTYGFDLKFEKQLNGQVFFTISPSSLLIRMAISPLRVVFDASSKMPVRYEGRVPPMERVSDKFKDLDARVEYSLVTNVYR